MPGPPQGSNAGPVTSEAFEVLASLDVDAVVTRITNEVRRLLVDYSQQGLVGAELAEAVKRGIDELSTVPAEQAGRMAAGEAHNLGRNLATQANLERIREVVRTEVLDENTCEPCRDLDSKIFQVNTPEYFENMPPNKCDGRELCRGFYYARAA